MSVTETPKKKFPDPPGPPENKWVWAMKDFAERLAEAVTFVRAKACEGMDINRTVPLAISNMIAGPPRIPYPLEQDVVDDLKQRLATVYFDAHNFGRKRPLHDDA